LIPSPISAEPDHSDQWATALNNDRFRPIGGKGSTKFALVAVVLALVLLFASIATKVSTPKVQVVLICEWMVLLTLAINRIATLAEHL